MRGNGYPSRMQRKNVGLPVDGASDGLLNKWTLAEKLHVSKRTVDALMKKGLLPYLKLGGIVRFRWPDVLEKLSDYRIN
jgi:excisionase family DNA binding protein